ncbi:PepSY domain-containing protein [Nocardioides sp. GXQ0305]|uniref:PepSY domain-containing protein n=1 Tax=Nocardioides sp. GXQ0305 TaxID=3423912 RepID=UPI003D7C97F0
MNRKQALITTSAVAVLVLGGGGAALAGSDDDATDRPVEGPALEQATDAALQETGGGEVTGTEVGDEESYYEVEVTLDDGSQVDVQLDRDFQVVSSEADHEDDGNDD